jgi:cytoskeletal protein CcmA (bactofilin family)
MGMFSAKNPGEQAQPQGGGLSIIAVGMTVRGDIESNGTVKVEGSVEGLVEARNQVLVAKGGVVQGDIDAREAVVGGVVHGAIRATDRVEVQAGALVSGDITTKRIAVAEGGTLNGQIRMSEPGSEPKAMPEPRSQSKTAPKSSTAAESPATPAPTPAPGTQSPRASVPVARVAVPPRLPSSGY